MYAYIGQISSNTWDITQKKNSILDIHSRTRGKKKSHNDIMRLNRQEVCCKMTYNAPGCLYNHLSFLMDLKVQWVQDIVTMQSYTREWGEQKKENLQRCCNWQRFSAQAAKGFICTVHCIMFHLRCQMCCFAYNYVCFHATTIPGHRAKRPMGTCFANLLSSSIPTHTQIRSAKKHNLTCEREKLSNCIFFHVFSEWTKVRKVCPGYLVLKEKISEEGRD